MGMQARLVVPDLEQPDLSRLVRVGGEHIVPAARFGPDQLGEGADQLCVAGDVLGRHREGSGDDQHDASVVDQTAPVPRRLASARPALLVVLVAFVALGLADGALGTVWPDLRDGFDRTDSSFGLIFTAWSGGYLAASGSSGHLSDRLGLAPTLRLGVSGAIAGLTLISTSPWWWIVLAGFALLGLGNGLTDATANAWVALTAGPREMGALHTAYGLGASTGPLLAAAFVASGDHWRGPFVVLLVLQLGIAVAIHHYRAGFEQSDAPREHSADDAANRPNLVALTLLAWFAVYVGAEVAVGSWSFTLLTESRSFGEVGAGIAVATYWIGLTVGRFALMVGGDRINPVTGLTGASVGAVGAAVWLWADIASVGHLSLPLLGLFFSVVFPLAVTLTPRLLGDERAARQVGYQFAAASAGAITIPATIGVLADRHGISIAGPVVAATVVVLALLWALVRREARFSPAGS